MSTWTKFYINSNDTKGIVDILISLTDDLDITYGDFPEDLHGSYLFNPELAPDYLVIGNTQPDWTTVSHNSFDDLEDWGIEITKQLGTKAIFTSAQSTSGAYYFALYDRGLKVREIKICYGSDNFTNINFGNKLDFENDEPGNKEDYEDGGYFFGFDEIAEYCSHFNLTIQADYKNVKWTVLRGKVRQETVNDFLKTLIKMKKPWWKFW